MDGGNEMSCAVLEINMLVASLIGFFILKLSYKMIDWSKYPDSEKPSNNFCLKVWLLSVMLVHVVIYGSLVLVWLLGLGEVLNG
jgi:hypothetical protein